VPIVRIRGDVAKVREQHGLASDLVPVDNTDIGRMVSGREVKLQSRYDCCARALMLPMHERMRQDGITLIVRGQRDDEYAAPPKRSGESGDGFEVLYPIQTWTGEQVSTFLKGNGLPLAQFYERGARRAPECMGCTAWWDEGRAGYMREHHPKAFEVYRSNMKTIRIEIDRQYQMLDDYSQRN
jgi:3'-phosphoadenosine 5'-phosphosulfate sulfotransferase (PAPS reductase)/FAD synthetase